MHTIAESCSLLLAPQAVSKTVKNEKVRTNALMAIFFIFVNGNFKKTKGSKTTSLKYRYEFYSTASLSSSL